MPMTATLLCAGLLSAAPVSFDRVDLLSEDPGLWLNYDLPLSAASWPRTAYRLVEQVKPVWRLRAHPPLQLGASLRSQSVVYEGKLPLGHLYWSAGIQTALLLPRGALGGLAWRQGHFRVAAGVSLLTSATWVRRDWGTVWVLPTLGFGIGPVHTD